MGGCGHIILIIWTVVAQNDPALAWKLYIIPLPLLYVSACDEKAAALSVIIVSWLTADAESFVYLFRGISCCLFGVCYFADLDTYMLNLAYGAYDGRKNRIYAGRLTMGALARKSRNNA